MIKVILQIIGMTALSVVTLFSVVKSMSLFIDCRYVPSTSMLPTLPVGSRIVFEKISSYENRAVERGVIVLCYAPIETVTSPELVNKISNFLRLDSYSEPEKMVLVKRIIGIPGDRIEIKKREGVFVNGKLLDETAYAADVPDYDLRVLGDFGKHAPSDPSSVFATLQMPSIDPKNANDPIVVPEGKIFVLGDNRNISTDSHVWGFMDKESILARSWAMFYPKIQSLNQPFQGLDLNAPGFPSFEFYGGGFDYY